MKRSLLIVTAVIMLFSLASCSVNTQQETKHFVEEKQIETAKPKQSAAPTPTTSPVSTKTVEPKERRSSCSTVKPLVSTSPTVAPVKKNSGQDSKVIQDSNDGDSSGDQKSDAGHKVDTGNQQDCVPEQKINTPATSAPVPPVPVPSPSPTSTLAATPTQTLQPAPTPSPEPKVDIAVCNTCGYEMTLDDLIPHGKSHTLNGENFSYYVK